MRVQKKELLQFIRSRDLVTFPEIEEFFKEKGYDYKGDTAVTLSDGVVMWYGWGHKALRVFAELYSERKVFLYQCEDAPPPPPTLGTKEVKYKWIPVMISARERT